MPNVLPGPTTVALSQIVADLQQVTELRIVTPIDGGDYVEITPTLGRTEQVKVNGAIQKRLVQSAPLPVVKYEGAALVALMADAFSRAKAFDDGRMAPALCLYNGIRDAVYAQLAADNGWTPTK